MLDSDTLEELVNNLDDEFEFSEPKVAHILDKDDVMRGYIFGEVVTAICGYRFIPTRDPNLFPLCQKCKELMPSYFRREV